MRLYPKYTQKIDKGITKTFTHGELQEIANILYMVLLMPKKFPLLSTDQETTSLREQIYDSCRAACISLEYKTE